MEITIDVIVDVLKGKANPMRMRQVKDAVIAVVCNEDGLFQEETKQEMDKIVENLIRAELKLGNESKIVKTVKNGYYKRSVPRKIPNTENGVVIGTNYIGTAGETAVMSELMFHGFNANRMMIDDGIDIIASKNNVYRYIQVKTSFVTDDKIICQIKKERYETHIMSQVRYVVVARYSENGIDRNMFFVLTEHDINKGIHDGYIKDGQESIVLKIKFHPLSRAPYLYDVKESDASYYVNNFKMI
jgi:hypothetical protein